MAKYIVIIKITIRDNDNGRIIQEITREKIIDCEPGELKNEILKKKEFLENKFKGIWEDTASVSITVTQILPL